MELTSTKDIILQTAANLFGKKGFSATSVREISKACEVNISAINYHFETKENLFHQVVANQYEMVDKKITALYKENLSFENFSLSVFRLFVQESTMLLCTYKMYLSDEFQNADKLILTAPENFGPPGINSFKKVLKNNNKMLTNTQAFFIIKNTFSVICHSAITLISPVLKNKLRVHPDYCLESQEKNIKKLIKALINSTK
jgi:AcrR family transcriptional regulator